MTDEMPPAETSPPQKSKEKKKKTKSQKRQRKWQINIPCLEHEFNLAAGAAAAAGLSRAAYGRARMFGGDPGPRSQRIPAIDAVLIRKVDGLHGMYGNNLNQIAYQLNAHGELATEAQFRQAIKEWQEIRDYHLQALGKLPPGRDLLSWKDLMGEVSGFLSAHPGEETICLPAHLLRRIVNNGPNISA